MLMSWQTFKVGKDFKIKVEMGFFFSPSIKCGSSKGLVQCSRERYDVHLDCSM